jgi:hypothetical protein
MDTWIKLYRKFSEWEWFNISEMVHLYIHLLLSANTKDGKWRGVDIKRGQLLTGLHSLNESTGISIQTIRTCLKRLKETGEINMQTNNQFRLITILKYDSYQDDKRSTNKQPNKRSTSDQQATNNKQEYKNIEYKNKNTINPLPDKNPADFIDQIVDLFSKTHGSYEIISRGKERTAAAKILGIYKKKYPGAKTEEVLCGLGEYFRLCVGIHDKWLAQNMSLPLIVDKFNVINNILKDGNNKGSGVTEQELARILAQKIGASN